MWVFKFRMDKGKKKLKKRPHVETVAQKESDKGLLGADVRKKQKQSAEIATIIQYRSASDEEVMEEQDEFLQSSYPQNRILANSVAHAGLISDPIMASSASSSPTSQSSQESSHPTSGSSPSSEVEAQAVKVKAIYSNSEVNSDDCSVSFVINAEQRPETLLDGQGDHVTSYVVIIMAILQSASDIGIRSAICNLQNLASTLLDGQFAVEEPKTYKAGFRKEIKKLLRKNDEMSEEQYRETVLSLKFRKVSILAKHLADIAKQMLIVLQQAPLTTTFSKGRENKSITEGIDAKNAAYALVALSRVCEISSMEDLYFLEKLPSILNSLSKLKRNTMDTADDHAIRYGLRIFMGNYQQVDVFLENREELQLIMKKYNEGEKLNEQEKSLVKESKQWFSNIKEKILKYQPEIVAKQIGFLFDYQSCTLF